MSTDTNLSTENQDLPPNQDGATTGETIEAVKNDDQEVFYQSIDNTPENPEDTSHKPINQDMSQKEIASNATSVSAETNSMNDEKSNDQKDPLISPPLITDHTISPNNLKVETINEEPTIAQLLKLIELLQENLNSMNERLAKFNERLAKLEESAKFKFDALVKDALKQDDGVWDEDHKECQQHIEQAKLWHSKTKDIYISVLTAISECGSRIDQCGDLMQEINKENSTLYNRLLNRYESLEINKRMLERLRDPIELLKKSTLPSEQLLRLQEQDLVDLLRSQNDEAEAKKLLDKKLKETGDTRYKAVREWRYLAEKLQKQWLSFIEKKLLPGLDGINEGKRHAEHLVNELKLSYKTETCREKLSAWLKTYVDLENILLDSLKSLGINQMSVERGQPVDYDRHEPFITEPDPDLPYESIKEVTRNGYEYKLPDEEQPLILRSAQVIVVKNK